MALDVPVELLLQNLWPTLLISAANANKIKKSSNGKIYELISRKLLLNLELVTHVFIGLQERFVNF